MPLDFVFYTTLSIMVFIAVAYAVMPFLTLPYIQFGIRLPEGESEDTAIRNLKRGNAVYSVVISAALVILYFLLYKQMPVLLSTQFPIIQIVLMYMIYYHFRRRARSYRDSSTEAHGEGQRVTAFVESKESRPALLWFIFPWIELGAFIAVGVWYYPYIPQVMATHYGTNGQANGFAVKSFLSAFSLLVVTGIPLLAFMEALAVLLVKVRPFQSQSSPKKSAIQMRGFNMLMSKMLMSIAAIVLLTLFISSAVIWQLLSSQYIYFTILPVIGLLPVVLVVSIRAGQGGWKLYPGLRESGDGAPAKGDDNYWWGGVVYHNRNDSSLLVPKRYGVGYTFNFAHPVSWLILGSLLGIPFIILLVRFL